MKTIIPLLIALNLVACAKVGRNTLGNDRVAPPPTGDLARNARELLADPDIESCDKVAAPMMRELTSVLDSKVTEISEFASTLPASKNYKMVPFGNSFLKEPIKPSEAKDEWTVDSESWTGAYAFYQEIKNEPMNRSWLQLNATVRSILLEDQDRILDGLNLELHHDAGEKIESLKARVDACISDSRCKQPAFTTDDEIFIDSNSFYSFMANRLKKNQDLTSLKKFQKRLEVDQVRFSFRFNETIKISQEGSKTIINLPYDGSEFSQEQKDQMAGYIQSMWSSAELGVKIQWQDSVTGLFKIFFDLKNPGERSYVMFHKKEVHLFPFTRTRSIAHETGHVLGFLDHYYTIWDPSNCVYNTESNESDVMSDSNGSVTSDEWKDLKKNYVK